MHAFRFFFPALVAVLLCAAQAGAQSSEESSDTYFRAYMMNNEADRLATAGSLQQALDKYKQAQQIFDTIAKTVPGWSPDMVAMRRTKVADAITAVQAKIAAAPPPAPVAPAPGPVLGGTALNGLPQSTAPAAAVAPAMPLAPSVPGAPPSVEDAMRIVKAAMDAREAPLQQQVLELQAQVGRYQLGYETALKQRDQVSGMYQTLAQQATTQQSKITDLEKQVASGGAGKAELEKLRAEQVETKAKLADLKANLTKAENTVIKQTKDLMENSMRLTGVQKEKEEMAKKLETISKDKDALMKELEKVKEDKDSIAKQLASANAEVIGLKASGPVPANLKDLTAENQRLRKDLDVARKQVETMKADGTRKDQEIAQLKGQLTSIQSDLVALKKENAAYESEVADLTLNLKKLRAEMLDPTKVNAAEATQLAAESQLLRSIILRQLRQQARQQQQKTALIAEIQKTENSSKELIDQVEQLGGARFTLTEDEQKLFTTPQLREINGDGGITATIMAKSEGKKAGPAGKVAEKPASGAAAVDGLLEKANELLRDGKFTEAATGYSDVLRADPKNASGFSGLAMAKMQLNKLDEAEVTLQKSLAYDAKNSNSHYLLGVTMFRRDRLNEALSSFQKSLELDGKNARARHYLGVISSKMGLGERAEREFKATLAIDPEYGEAYFNLAVLYATWDPPKWDEARKNYKEAVKKGVKPDPNMEKLLNDGAPSVSKR